MKKGLPSILLSREFFTKPRNRKWIRENGSDAVIILQTVWIASSQESDCRIRKSEAAYLPYPLPFSDEVINLTLQSAVAVGLLEEEGDYYFNSQIVEDQKNFNVKQENYVKGRQKREAILPESREDSARILTESSENHIESRIVNNEDLNSLFSLKSPEKLSFYGPETIAAVERWGAHRHKLNKTFDILQAEALLMSYNGRYDDLVKGVNHSITNGWMTIVVPKEDTHDPPRNGHHKETNFEKNMRLLGMKTHDIIGNQANSITDSGGVPGSVSLQRSDASPMARMPERYRRPDGS